MFAWTLICAVFMNVLLVARATTELPQVSYATTAPPPVVYSATAYSVAAPHVIPHPVAAPHVAPHPPAARPAAAHPVADCLSNSLDSDSIYCRGSRAIRNVIRNLKSRTKPLVLMRGFEIVPVTDRVINDTDNGEAPHSDDSFLGYVSEYLRTHELNIKFSDLLADESENYLLDDLLRNNAKVGYASGAEEARKKDKGQGLILAMAMMFGKMMAVMGMGGIGALAMKALGVAMAALMMAGLVGLKSLASHGNESSHSVSYVTADGHHHKRRRRRSLKDLEAMPPLAYRAWWPKMDKTAL